MRRIANFFWKDAELSGEAEWLSETDDDQAGFIGQFALEGVDSRGRKVLARDRLGVNKLFFYLDGGELRWSNFLIDLLNDGVGIESIWSVPSGHAVHIGEQPTDYELRKHINMEFHEGNNVDNIGGYAKAIREGLEKTFGLIAQAVGTRQVYVTMSGGLDSTTIAALARDYLPNLTGVTFSLKDDHNETESEDARFAMRVADDLDIPIRLISCTTDSMMELLDQTLIYGQDFRDFNVHCGLVNAVIARELDSARAAPTVGVDRTTLNPVVLTGDTMNELMADYAELNLDGRIYYQLPRMKKSLLRRFLVNGLDSGDREVGIFAHYGFDVIQPYALCAEQYAALPGELISAEDSKQRLVAQVMGRRIPDYVLKRPKVRAQAGDAAAGQGILGAFKRAAIDQQELTHRFSELMKVSVDDVRRLIGAGFYRFTERYPGNSI